MNVIDVDQKGKDDGSKKGFKIMIRRDIHQVINLYLEEEKTLFGADLF